MKIVKLVFYKKEVNKEITTLSYKTKTGRGGEGLLKSGVLILVGVEMTTSIIIVTEGCSAKSSL